MLTAKTFSREIARLWNTPRKADDRTMLLRAFGADGVHFALAIERSRAEEREEQGYRQILASSDRCDCTTCMVYGGDCAWQLRAEGLRPILYRWQRKAGVTRFARPVDELEDETDNIGAESMADVVREGRR